MIKLKQEKRINPEDISDYSLERLTKSLGLELGFDVHVFGNELQIWPSVPELREWNKKYPVLIVKLNTTGKNGELMIKIAKLLGGNPGTRGNESAFMAEEFLKSQKWKFYEGMKSIKIYHKIKELLDK